MANNNKNKSYSLYQNWLDMPYKFLGSFPSRKAALAARKEVAGQYNIHDLPVIPEPKPDYEVGQDATGWNKKPVNYADRIR